MKTKIAVYFDLENINPKFDLDKLLDAISLKIEDSETVFVYKFACGNENAISNFRDKLKDWSFEIREAPKVSKGNPKNRADLILSLEAFETIVQKIPEIDIYVFITSDTDFTVVAEKLRKYGKEVWLVVRKSDKSKTLFIHSADEILVIDDYFTLDKKEFNKKYEKVLKNLKDIPSEKRPQSKKALAAYIKTLLRKEKSTDEEIQKIIDELVQKKNIKIEEKAISYTIQ
uniref:NYN domain-containing protein n=1 Tax=uncultured Spirochaetaceae bacterium TaxID=201186 RepID=A0A650ENC4_9SPIO|nr:NYN domain-containing protein [uncultured Spirochaetaceae bacterium]